MYIYSPNTFQHLLKKVPQLSNSYQSISNSTNTDKKTPQAVPKHSFKIVTGHIFQELFQTTTYPTAAAT